MTDLLQESGNQLEHVLYSRNVANKHSKAVQKLLDLVINYIPDAEKAYREGKNVVWGSQSTAIYASGAIPVAVTEVGRLGSQESITVAEDYFQVPNETCAMVKATLGEFYLRKDTTIKRLIFNGRSCEQYNQAFEAIKPFGYDILLLSGGFKPSDGDSKRFDNLRKLYAEEFKLIAEWIRGGKPFDNEELRRELHRYNRIQRKIRTIINLRKHHSTYVLTLPTMLLLTGNAHYYGKPEEYEEILEELIEELSALDEGEYNDAKVSLVWAGARGQEFNIFEAIDNAGGAVLGWAIPNNLEASYDETKEDPFEALLDFELGGKSVGTSLDKAKVVERTLNKYNAKGIILYQYVGCSFGTIDAEYERSYFKEKGTPSLALIGSFDVGAPTGQVVTRVKAFVEMLS